ncbi:hypothetical protein B0T14DRAFT_500096 [Immersiella caudata]|uniref:Uncharacterized protein n=1 Tax=Immersiella caudata TaxID=314043 RepID=A0AA39W9Z9_9PEZI|nr:hypothetical protein B0T14DRAFT_500096 [Immersiella caudata]
MPLALVNIEALAVAIDWCRRNRMMKLSYSTDASGLPNAYATRAFHPQWDVMYVPEEQWDLFAREPGQVFGWSSHLDEVDGSTFPTRLAVTEGAFAKDWSPIAPYLNLEALFILQADETWGEDAQWWSERYFSGPVNEWCRFEINRSEERYWTRDEGWVTRFHNVEWDDLFGEEMERTRFRRMTRHAFSTLSSWKPVVYGP